jgi:hypothetical protein
MEGLGWKDSDGRTRMEGLGWKDSDGRMITVPCSSSERQPATLQGLEASRSSLNQYARLV